MTFLKKYWKSIIWTSLVVYALVTPSSNLPKQKLFSFEHMDKIIHLGIFGLLVLLVSSDIIRNTRSQIWRANLIALGIAMFVALATEFIQYQFVSDRSGDIYDLYANLTGMILACIFIIWAKRFSIISSYLGR